MIIICVMYDAYLLLIIKKKCKGEIQYSYHILNAHSWLYVNIVY